MLRDRCSARARVQRVWAVVRSRAAYVFGSLLVLETLLHAVPAWTLVRHSAYLERRALSGYSLVALPVFVSNLFFSKVHVNTLLEIKLFWIIHSTIL